MARQEISFVMLEQRYRTENQLLDAVAAGDEETAEKISQQMNRYNYGGRFQGDVMAVRHKLIILNTLFRKSIEHCGIHPYYIDEISARFAVRIQNMTLEEDRELIQEMIREYCAYVTKYSLENYSSVVQNAIHQICFHLNGTLLPRTVRKMPPENGKSGRIRTPDTPAERFLPVQLFYFTKGGLFHTVR